MAVNLGRPSLTVNGVASQASTLTGENFQIGGQVVEKNHTDHKITGASAALAANSICEGNPRPLPLTKLKPGVTYETTIFSIGVEVPGGASAKFRVGR